MHIVRTHLTSAPDMYLALQTNFSIVHRKRPGVKSRNIRTILCTNQSGAPLLQQAFPVGFHKNKTRAGHHEQQLRSGVRAAAFAFFSPPGAPEAPNTCSPAPRTTDEYTAERAEGRLHLNGESWRGGGTRAPRMLRTGSTDLLCKHCAERKRERESVNPIAYSPLGRSFLFSSTQGVY